MKNNPVAKFNHRVNRAATHENRKAKAKSGYQKHKKGNA
jgi:hypothetical protein